jgi:hypothetical protein
MMILIVICTIMIPEYYIINNVNDDDDDDDETIIRPLVKSIKINYVLGMKFILTLEQYNFISLEYSRTDPMCKIHDEYTVS